MRFSISASSLISWRRFSSLRLRLGRVARLLGVGRRQGGQHLAHLREHHHLLLLHRLDLFLRVLGGVAQVRERGGRQRRGGAARCGLAAAGQRGLGDGLRLLGLFVGLGVDQDHLERRVLEHAVEAFGVDEADRQQHRVDGDRNAERDLQGAEGLQVHEGGLSAGAVPQFR